MCCTDKTLQGRRARGAQKLQQQDLGCNLREGEFTQREREREREREACLCVSLCKGEEKTDLAEGECVWGGF